VAGFGGKLLPFHLATGGQSQCFHDITHGWVPQHSSWNGGAMDSFVKRMLLPTGCGAPATMGYYEREDLPFYWALAEAFTICDGYYCSCWGRPIRTACTRCRRRSTRWQRRRALVQTLSRQRAKRMRATSGGRRCRKR